MVSIGTVITLGIVGGLAIVGYALYRNASSIGGAFSRGVTQNVTDPFGDYFENLFKDSTTNGGTPSVPDPTKPAFGLLPEAVAQKPTGDVGITPKEATWYEKQYLERAQTSARTILASFAPSSQEKLITTATAIAEKSATPLLTQAYSIVDQARVSVGGKEPLTNKFYRLFTLANKPYYDKVLPLSREAVQFYAKQGVIAREVYL